VSNPGNLRATISLPSDFVFGEVPPAPRTSGPSPAPPSLGPLAAFVGNWTGSGFNTIFRPDNSTTPTVLPIPFTTGDNILELNLTSEDLSFSPSLGSVPNRGTTPQGDIYLNGVPYLQTIKDVTNPSQPVGIHVEPGLWMIVPPTSDPAEGQSLVRMASIPHGTTIEAQGTWTSSIGAPNIPAVDITPFFTSRPDIPANQVTFESQTATAVGTPRIPQDLTAFIAAGTITQAMLDDPNTVLRNRISKQTITATTTISISTNPAAPLFGGGVDNIAFLGGDPPPNGAPNAQTLQMTATFWIETVEQTILVPIFKLGEPPLIIEGDATVPGPVPEFLVRPPFEIPVPRPITFTFTQIQYSQTVLLNFAGLTWPHVSVATLVPSTAIAVPPTAWA
jgi:hypothetical protein